MTSILDALIQVESNGIPGRRGPVTKYGQALGLGQTLPETAREMAQKLGLPWRPDLLTSPTPEGANYQRKVSQAYYDEGLQRTGNPRDALRYYHGGPNRRQWGPKTNAYADKVLALAGGDKMGYAPERSAPTTLPEAYQRVVEKAGGPTYFQDDSLPGIMQADPAELIPQSLKLKGPKAFGEGGKGWVIAGIIADALAKGFGGQGQFAPTYLAGQEHNRQLDLWRQKVAQDRADRLDDANLDLKKAIALAQYKAQNPAAQQPTSLERNIEYLKRLNPGLSDQEAYAIARQNINRPIVIGNTPYGLEGGDEQTDAPQPVQYGTDPDTGRRVVRYSDGSVDYAD